MTKDELLFNTWLSSVNTRLGRYVVRLMEESVHVVRPGEESRYRDQLGVVEVELAQDLTELARAIAGKAAGESYSLDGRR
ncbi:hypothetical protein ABZ816_24915 [Actinosynnema sp. NPDC047251]|uniref:hypothetical protein n=1 Tax=Saccharothrix espanaensis TaxID=103731 RepID=UPI0011DD8E8E|nr:hypothetical protein [Saccharothrix espanaensis]